jgi:hypothetical protein
MTNLVLCISNENTVCGKHYHKGSSENKNPEILYLIQGSLIFRWRIFDEEDEIKEKIVTGPTKFIIPILVWHEFKTITPVIFLELNSFIDGKNDVVHFEF